MKTSLSTKLTLSVCALVGGVFLSSASAKPFKLFSNDRDRDRDREEEADPRPKVYIVTDEPIQPGSTGIVRVIPKAIAVDVPKEESKPVLTPEPKSRKTRTGETRFVEPKMVQEETTTGIATVPRKAEAIEQTRERVTTTEERPVPVKTSRSSSRKESVATTKMKVPQPQREDVAEVKTEVATTRQTDREVPVAPKREAVEESTSTPVVRTTNPLMPNPSGTEERKPLMPAESPAPSPEVPTLSAPSDFANATASPRPPANLPSGTIEKTGSKPNIPVAEKTDKPGFVNTPFTPKKLIDVRGMASGSLAKDPSTNQVFRVP